MGRSRRPRPKRLNRKLKRIRQNLGYTMAQMAKALDYSHPAHISGFENAKREPTYLLIVKYAKLAGCSSDYLIDDGLQLPSDLATNNKRFPDSALRG